MTYRIKKGKHRAWPWLFGLWFNKTVLRKQVRFDLSAKYDLGSDEKSVNDQMDTNKLFGIGYLFNHHWNSARFGWRFNKQKNKIEILAYCYAKGFRVIREICDVEINHNYKFVLLISPVGYDFIVTDWDSGHLYGNVSVFKEKPGICSYPLGLYFGGNRTAPCDITIKMKKL